MKKTLALSVLSLTLFAAGAALADCPQLDAECVVFTGNGVCDAQGTTYVDSCWSYFALECEPCAHANDQCNAAFSGCNGNCSALSTDQSGAECNNSAFLKGKGVAAAVQNKNSRYIKLQAAEAQLAKRHAKELTEKMDDDSRQFLTQRQAFEKQLLHKMQAEALQNKGQRKVATSPAATKKE